MAASTFEETATSPAFEKVPLAAGLAPKARSCVVCRRRKVRCDKQSPCSNCRRANIACVVSSTDRPPRWARRLERFTNNAAAPTAPVLQDADSSVGKVKDRLRTLETLVKELTSQLEHAQAAANSNKAGSSGSNSPRRTYQDCYAEHQSHTSPAASTGSSAHTQYGRLVHQDASRSRYVSSDFWSRINDELEGLKMDTRSLGDDSDSSEDETFSGKSPPSKELERTPAERHAFLFRHNLTSSCYELHQFHPLPSQIPFLLSVFADNVNFFAQIVHMPTITKLVRDWRSSDMTSLNPANEALMLSIYYAAVTSMEKEDIITNFGSSKTDLHLRYRLGLEYALAKADFLNAPNIVLVQAFAIFLCLARRYDSPNFVWMMTGLVIRMAQYLGLQKDGSHLQHLTPFETEMRRRVWWGVCMLDMRASDDQGTDLTITSGSFDTEIPLNINDADINPDSKETPTEREGITDMSFARIWHGLGVIMRQIVTLNIRDGAGLERQSRLLSEIYQKYEQGYFRNAAEPASIAYWVAVTIARLVMAKLTLIVFLPVLFSSPSPHFSDEIRTKLLISAIEVAEYNHALNAEQACRQWRWIYQTYTHWHAIVYLLIEISRRPWSALVERGWVALHSRWLIPDQISIDKTVHMWFPLRNLMTKARKHRDAELRRLRRDPQAAARLDIEDQKIPLPSSFTPLPADPGDDIHREQWRKLVVVPEELKGHTQTAASFDAGLADPSNFKQYTSQPNARSIPAYSPGYVSSNTNLDSTFLVTHEQQAGPSWRSTSIGDSDPATLTDAPSKLAPGETIGPSNDADRTGSIGWSNEHAIAPRLVHWLWADADPSVDVFSNFDMNLVDANMDLDSEVDWYNWVESAKGLEWDTRQDSDRPI